MRLINSLLVATLLLLLPVTQASADTVYPGQPWIRAALTTDVTSVTVTTSGASFLNRVNSSQTIGEYSSGHTFTFGISSGAVTISGESSTNGFSVVCDDPTGRLTVNGGSYRRVMRIVPWNNRLACVNVLPIEEYLWGVVPCEVPNAWPEESLRAQAIAARTYALRALEQYPDRPFDVYSSVADQVYRGVGSERESTTLACNDTYGKVCTYGGTPIIAYYHAASGGWTASGIEMFGRDLPYLRAVPSRDASIHRWVYPVSATTLANALRTEGFLIGTIQRVWVHRFSGEGRAEEVKVVHSSGVTLVSGADIRSALGPGNIQSTYFRIEGQEAPDIPDDSKFVIDLTPSTQANTIQHYACTHPQVWVPIPSPQRIGEIALLASDGIEYSTRYYVLGTDGYREYISGYVWVAEPVQVRDIDVSFNEIFSLSSFQTGTPMPSGEIVDDPGSGIGVPSNGTFTFVGHGCGHGVGMSQHGARILAESGWINENILKYFYTGVDIQQFW